MFVSRSMVFANLTCLVAACGYSGSITSPSGNKTTQFPAPVARFTSSDDDAARGNIHIACEVRVACDLTGDEAYFAFDLAYIRAQSRQTLRTLAACIASGPLKGHEIDLIGQVDLHGPRDRNESVARRRAANVRQLIVAESTDANTTVILAKESIDSTGTSEAPWVEDGCVDVQCVDVVASRRYARALSLNY